MENKGFYLNDVEQQRPQDTKDAMDNTGFEIELDYQVDKKDNERSAEQADPLPPKPLSVAAVQVPPTKSIPTPTSNHNRPRSFTISYETVVWLIFWVTTILCIVDHFVMKGDIVLKRSGKLPSKIWSQTVGETITNVIWAVTARLIITAQNLMFYTTMWCCPNILYELLPHWVTLDGIRDIHLRIHRIAGIFLIAVPSLAHVLVIFLPPLVDGTKLTYHSPSSFNYSESQSHMNWSKIWDPAAVENWAFNDRTGVHLTSDEIYRFMLMIVLFCFIFPLSRSNFVNNRSYSMAISLHVFAGIWYAIDNIRKITHGLAHVFNLPMLLLWCIDRLVSVWFYRHHSARIVKKQVIGHNEYIVAYIKVENTVSHAVGDIYYILHPMLGASQGILPQRSHPFTTFANLSTHPSWDIGLVMTVMKDNDQLCLPWTSWLANDEDTFRFHTWGPYRSSVRNLRYELMNRSSTLVSEYVFFATGSGCGYILDVLSTLGYKCGSASTQKGNQRHVNIYYSVRCKALYDDFLRKPIDKLMKKIQKNNSAIITLNVYISGHKKSNLKHTVLHPNVSITNGRINFEKIINSRKELKYCYFVGRPAIAELVEKICKKKGVRLVKNYTNGPGQGSDRSMLFTYLTITFWAMLIIIVVCVLMRVILNLESIIDSIDFH